MKAITRIPAALFFGLYLLHATGVHADEAKVPESVKQEVVEAEQVQPEQEKTEEGEASGNIRDCEQSNDSSEEQGGADEKDLDDCEALIK